MDYDDSDFQSQNFQIVGEDIREENNKFPSLLRSFALPSFDLDDHLQVHLRFDNLVEPGNLLGITRQEENNWIESFSTGGGAIGSSAAESCSISRNNNVWSEATSSESVEMLLKSVGEDDMMENKTTSEQPNDRNILNNQTSTTTNCRTTVPVESKMEDLGDANTTLPENSHNSSPKICENKENAPSTDDQTFVDEEPLISECPLDPVGCHSDDAHANDTVICLSAAPVEGHIHQEEPSINQKCLERVSEENSLNHSHLLGQTRSDSSHVNMQIVVSSSADTMDVIALDKSAGKATNHVSAEHDKILTYETSSMLPSCLRVENQSLHSSEPNDKGGAIGSSGSASVDPSGLEQQKLEDPSSLLMERFNELTYSKKSDGLLEVIIDQAKLASNDSDVAGQIPTESKVKSFENLDVVNDVNVDSEKSNKEDISTSSIQLHEVGTTADMEKADGAGFHMESTELVQVVDTAMVVMEEKLELAHCESESKSKEKSNILIVKEDEEQESEATMNEKHSDQNPPAEALVVNNLDNLSSEKLHCENAYPMERDKSRFQVSSVTGEVEQSHEYTRVGESHEVSTSFSPAIITCKYPTISPENLTPVSDSSLEAGISHGNTDQAKDGSSTIAHDESPKWEIVQKNPDTSNDMSNSPMLVPSCKSEGTNQLPSDGTSMSDEAAVDNELVSSRLESSKSVPSDISSQISSGSCIPVRESCDNSQTASLHVDISNSEPNVASISEQLMPTEITNSSEMQNSISVKVQEMAKNEFPSSTDKHKSIEAIDQKGHPTTAIETTKAEFESPASSISGDTLHLEDHSVKCVASTVDESMTLEVCNTNLSEHNCGSPNIVSLVQHGHDAGNIQENNKGSADDLQTSHDLHCASSLEKASCGTESVDENAKEKHTFPGDKSFTFEVGQLAEHPEEMAAKGWKPFSSPRSSDAPQVTSTKSGYDQCDSADPRDISQVRQLIPHEGSTHEIGKKDASADKPGISAVASATRQKTKEKSTSKKIVEKRENESNTLTGSFGTNTKDMQSEEGRKHSSCEGPSFKPSCSSPPTLLASNLPDLNSTTTTAVANQPFTDSQQVQLRAQIFVYGSLIQGIPPDEACMVSAFGDVDGRRGKWEGVWRAVLEKYENQKSPHAICETPSHPVVNIPDLALRSTLLSKASSSPTPRTGSKGPPAAIFSPVSLPSPLWSVSTRDKVQSNASRTSHLEHSSVLPALHSYQSPNFRQYTGSTHWLTQSSSPALWVSPSNTSLDTGSKQLITPISDAIQFTPHRDFSVIHGSDVQFQSPSSAFPVTGNRSSSNVPATLIDSSKEVISARKKHASADQRSRRRKRDSVSEVAVQMLPVSEPQTRVEHNTGISKLTCSSSQADISRGASSSGLASTVAPITSPTHFHVVGSGCREPKVIFTEETYGKIEQAKLQAEDAASFAAAAVSHSEGIWKQLANQKGSGVVSEVEEKLASAAVAAAAAAAVAKAASAAAKLAADSALQAKLMADEAMTSGKTVRELQNCEHADQRCGDNLSLVTPASILRCKEKSSSHSIIPAAREAARRRLEAASAATKKAENLDAIVKAAELAAEAVSQAGAIAAMGEPLSLSFSELLKGGPDGYWRTQHSKGAQIGKTNATHNEKQSAFDQHSFNEKDAPEIAGGEIACSSADLPMQSHENRSGDVLGSVSPETLVCEDGNDQVVIYPSENVIQEGSLVEVMSDVKGRRGVWYSARVLNLKDSKAYVCYSELLNGEGSDKIKEWIPLDNEDHRAPRIRVSHHTAAKISEGPRKRRRSMAATYTWDVGDQVDAWISEGWREGVIAEKSKEDSTKFIIHFPAGGDTLIVRSWDLRPSCVWNDGQWVEWSRSQTNISEHHEGDTPVQKKRRISRSEAKNNSEAETLGVSIISQNARSDDSQKAEDFVPLALSSKEKSFCLGKGVREESNSEKIKRTGLQKEGSKVIFGIPKPGKKRKFMDVSKHCVVGNTEKTSESVKFSKYLIPKSSTGWKNAPKVDARGKRSADLKSKISKPVKSRNIPTKGLADKGKVLSSSSGEGNSRVALTSSKPSSSRVDSRLEKKDLPEVGLHANRGTTEDPLSVSHSHETPEVLPESMSSFVESEKDNQTHFMENFTTNEERASSSCKVIPDTAEPRRSNRRIQPTSRLLEGLQSSLIIAKIPSVSHDKGSKVSHRSLSSSRGHARS